MEDQGKRLLLAVAIAFAIMMLWNQLFPAAKPPQPDTKPEDGRSRPAEVTPGGGAARDTAPGGGAAAVESGGIAGAPGGTAAAKARGAEQSFVLEFSGVRATFSSWGGVLKSWQLLGPQFHSPGKREVPEELVRLADLEHRPFTVSFTDGSTYAIPAQADWQGEKKSDRELVFTWHSDDLAVTKRYRIHPDNYLLELEVVVQLARGSAKQGLVLSLFSQQDPKTRKKGGWGTQGREWMAACYVDDELTSWDAQAVTDRVREERGHVGWAGFLHSFFIFAAAPLDASGNLGCKAYGVTSAPGGMGVDLVYPMATLEAGKAGALTARTVAYLGPKYLEKLEGVAAIVGESSGFEKAVNLGFWGFIAGPMLWLLERLHALAGSWGIAIVLLTILVKLATLYWTHKSMKSMKEMAKLRPQLDKIKEKYQDDRQKQQVETMNLFKAHGVNPLAGCLPLLLQMPIWFALYRALSVAAELYQAPFLWLSDLTAPDPFFILPIFMIAASLLQSRLTPTTGTGAQQAMLTYGMPIMFGVMGFFFPAGLSLYISTNTVLTLLHHLYMRKSAEREIGKPGNKPAAEKASAGAKEMEIEVPAEAADAPRAERAVEEDAATEGVGEDEPAKSGPAPARNGQRPRGPTRGNRSGRRGGRRKRSSRPS